MKVLDILRGDFCGFSTPLHPALVFFPIVFIQLSAFTRFLGTSDKLISYLPGIDSQFAFTSAYYLNTLALLSLVPVIVTGTAEYLNINRKNKKAICTVNRHIILNVAISIFTLYNWLSVSSDNSFKPSQLNIGLGILSSVLLFWSGHLGGKLTYQHGVGVQRQNEGLDERKRLPNPNIVVGNASLPW